jgi:glutamyl-Q tRNA(Asp) synthetase
MTQQERTRFAPSPTGYLHIGHAFSALFAARTATQLGGDMLLRIEDIDVGRCRPEFEVAIADDLTWLGLNWPKPVRRQSEHFDDYTAALAILDEATLLYPCFCTRAEISAEIDQSPTAPHGPDGPIYPGTCRDIQPAEAADRKARGDSFALRLNMAKALQHAGPNLTFDDKTHGHVHAEPGKFGDVVLARKDTPTSYHLAVTVDDHIQGITCVTRGEDLFEATHIHRLLQHLLGYATPRYAHHPLIHDAEGRRLAKRDQATSLQELRKRGLSPDDVRALMPPSIGIPIT